MNPDEPTMIPCGLYGSTAHKVLFKRRSKAFLPAAPRAVIIHTPGGAPEERFQNCPDALVWPHVYVWVWSYALLFYGIYYLRKASVKKGFYPYLIFSGLVGANEPVSGRQTGGNH